MRKHILIIIMLVVLILILASCFAQVSEVNSDEIAAERTAERQRILDELPPPTILAETAYFQSIDSLAYMLSGALGGYPLIIRVEVLDEGWEELEESRSTLWRVWIRNLRVTEVFLGDVQVGEVLRLRQTIYRKTPLLPGDDVIMFVVSAGNIIVSLNAVQSMYLVPPEIDMSQVIINGDLSMNLPSGTVFESVHPQNRLVLTIEDLGKIVRGEMPAPRPEPPPPPEPTIRLSQTRWWPGAAASSTVVEVDTDLGRWYTDVFVFADYDWLFVEQSGDTLVIRVDENLSEYPRIGMVDIISGDDVRGVVVTQSNEELTSRLSFYVVGEPGNGFEELRGFGVYGAAGADNDGPSVSPLLITPAFPPVFVQPPVALGGIDVPVGAGIFEHLAQHHPDWWYISDPQSFGHIFMGWYIVDLSEEIWIIDNAFPGEPVTWDTVMPYEDITITLHWFVDPYALQSAWVELSVQGFPLEDITIMNSESYRLEWQLLPDDSIVNGAAVFEVLDPDILYIDAEGYIQIVSTGSSVVRVSIPTVLGVVQTEAEVFVQVIHMR